MSVLIGTDEAGYGPNLGPLVITATSWSVPDEFDANGLWACLTDVVCNEAPKTSNRLHVADSKQVYSASRSIEALELSALAFSSLLTAAPLTVRQLGAAIAGNEFADDYAAEPWNDQCDFPIPVIATVDRIHSFRERLQVTLAEHHVQLNAICSRVIFADEFNSLVDAAGSKGHVLSTATLALVRSGTEDYSGPLTGHVICDKHGGRNRYDDLIAEAFDDQFVFRLQESRQVSRYRIGNLNFCFRTKAEELLPVALASIVSKYLREILMMQFNRFWQTKIPGLRSTKGYPLDARRFWRDISVHASGLRIEKRRLWRQR